MRVNTYFILLNNGTGYIVILFNKTALLCGFTGSSATISDIYSMYLEYRYIINNLFVLRFYGPVNPMGSFERGQFT